MKTSTLLTCVLFLTLCVSSYFPVLDYSNWISQLAVGITPLSSTLSISWLLYPIFHCLGFEFPEVAPEGLSTSNLLKRGYWEARVKAWASETEKGRKPLQGVLRSRLLLWAARAQADHECVRITLPPEARQVRCLSTNIRGPGAESSSRGTFSLSFLASLLSEGQACFQSWRKAPGRNT